MFNYCNVKAVDLSFTEAQDAVAAELEKEGFLLVSQINVHEMVKEELGESTLNNYTILGFCNALVAHRAIQVEESAGVLLPYNVAIYAQGSLTTVGFIKPEVVMGLVDNEELKNLAQSVASSFEQAFDRLPG
jgi:uncharacterized protein (DUF302 family)